MSLQKFNSSIQCFKIFTLLFFFLLKCNLLFAQQEITDSVKAYEYWSKRGIIEVVYAYMNDYIHTVTDSSLPKQKQKKCIPEKTGLNKFEINFITPLEDLKIEKLSLKFDSISAFLINNNWSRAEKNLFQPLLNNQKNNKALNNDFFDISKPSGDEKSTNIPGYDNKLVFWNETVNKIINDYNENLGKVKTSIISEKDTNVTDDTNKTIETAITPTTVPYVQNWLILALSSLLSFLFGIFLCYFIITRRIYHQLDDDEEKYRKSISRASLFSFLSIIKLLKRRKDDYKNRVQELELKLNEIEKRKSQVTISAVNDSVNTTEIKTNQKTKNTVEWIIDKEIDNISLLFFSIPETDGRFIIDKGEQKNDGNKYYRIEFRNNSDNGALFYISGTQDKRAINRLDSYLKPVCDIDNILNAESATKIELLKHGKVIKIADSWVIDADHKVKIRLV